MREIECYNCHEFGHYAADCSQANHRKEEANLVEEDLEPTLLMAVTEDRRKYEDNSSDEKENSYLTSLAEYLNDEEPKWPRSSIERNENAKLRELKSEIEMDIKGKLEIWRLDMLHEFEATKQELKSELENRETELEKRMHKEKKLFEEEMKKELESLKSLREATNKEIEEVKIERAKLEKEKQDVLASQIHPEDEQLEEKEQERDGSMISRKKQDRVGDLSTKDEPVKAKEDGVQVEEDELRAKDDQERYAHIEETVRDKDKVKAINIYHNGRNPKFRHQDILQQARGEDDET